MSRFLDDWGPELVAAGGATVVAFAGGALTEIGPWYGSLKKPSWQPPNWLFAPAWTLIFVLAATAAVMGWYGTTTTAGAATLIALFILNGILNVLWSLFFFKLRRPDWAQLEVGFLWLSIVSLIVVVAVHAGRACLLLSPYLLWVSFAAFLNTIIVRLNAPFKGR